MQHAGWIAQAREHWREHQPQKYARLKEAGELEEALQEAAELTSEEIQQLVDQGFDRLQAWEMVRENYLFPPEEPGASEDEDE